MTSDTPGTADSAETAASTANAAHTENTAHTEKRSNPHAAQVLKLADAMLRTAVWPAAAVVVVGAVVAAVWVGTPGLLGAVVGGAVAFGSSLATLWMMRRTSGMELMAVLALALGGYLFKMLVLLGVMVLLGGIDALHPYALAGTFLAVVLVWAAAEVVAFRRTKIPTIIPG